jgi:hypothetical protein
MGVMMVMVRMVRSSGVIVMGVRVMMRKRSMLVRITSSRWMRIMQMRGQHALIPGGGLFGGYVYAPSGDTIHADDSAGDMNWSYTQRE